MVSLQMVMSKSQAYREESAEHASSAVKVVYGFLVSPPRYARSGGDDCMIYSPHICDGTASHVEHGRSTTRCDRHRRRFEGKGRVVERLLRKVLPRAKRCRWPRG